MKTLSNDSLTIQVSPQGAELSSIVPTLLKKDIFGKPIRPSGNAILLFYSPLSAVYGTTNTTTTVLLITSHNTVLHAIKSLN